MKRKGKTKNRFVFSQMDQTTLHPARDRNREIKLLHTQPPGPQLRPLYWLLSKSTNINSHFNFTRRFVVVVGLALPSTVSALLSYLRAGNVRFSGSLFSQRKKKEKKKRRNQFKWREERLLAQLLCTFLFLVCCCCCCCCWWTSRNLCCVPKTHLSRAELLGIRSSIAILSYFLVVFQTIWAT